IELTTRIKGKVVDSLPIYMFFGNSSAFLSGYLYYFIGDDKIWLLEILHREDGTDFTYWKEYKLDGDSGKFIFLNGGNHHCNFDFCDEETKLVADHKENTIVK